MHCWIGICPLTIAQLVLSLVSGQGCRHFQNQVYKAWNVLKRSVLVQTSPCGEVWFEIWLKAHGNFFKAHGKIWNHMRRKVAINFDFRSGAKKSGHLDYPLQSYGPYFLKQLILTNRLKMRFFKMEKCNFLKILQ